MMYMYMDLYGLGEWYQAFSHISSVGSKVMYAVLNGAGDGLWTRLDLSCLGPSWWQIRQLLFWRELREFQQFLK